jgi:AcrR family transcriptional regulator
LKGRLTWRPFYLNSERIFRAIRGSSQYNDTVSDSKPQLISVSTVADSKPRKSDRTRAAILNGALEFLWTQPFREMTVAELMSITGVGRSAFYQYFHDLHELMETLLQGVAEAIFGAADPWFNGEGEATVLLPLSLAALVEVCYERGPILRAVAEASTTDERLERAWAAFLAEFDDAVSNRIMEHQAEGLIAKFDARPVAIALNRLDASLVIHAFGRHPRSNPEPVREAITRIWMSTLYQSNYKPDS